jgi:transposase InsO family protein
MLMPLVYQAASRLHPQVGHGRWFHLRGLQAFSDGDTVGADRWFELAALRYREELTVEALARVRVHQLMARARSADSGAAESAAMIEIVRRLNRLDLLERLRSPYELADARVVLADWIELGAPRSHGPESFPAAQAA